MSARAVVIVQARLGSSRLPGKVLETLNRRTVLRRVLERCTAMEGIAAVCCAVPEGGSDDPVAEEALACGVAVTRGPENDVLQRYYQAAREWKADVIVRVTSDCPLIDPAIASQVLRLVTEGGADYACNNVPPSWPHGLDCEAFRFDWLERAHAEAELPSEREHVTPFLRNHAETKKLVLPGPGGKLTEHRWTLDTASDLQFLKALFERMPEGRESYAYSCPLSIVEKDPQLAQINAGHDREAGLKKSLAEDLKFLSRA